MMLFVFRHGKAEQGTKDDLRRLTDRGRKDVELMGKFLRDMPERPDVVWHSPKARAVETADILIRTLGFDGERRQKDGIAPEDSAQAAAQEIDAFRVENPGRNLLIVSHLPFVGDLASCLLSGGHSFHFATSACLGLEAEAAGPWNVRFFLTPHSLKD